MKYCYKCGAELFDEAVICPKCGCQQPSSAVSHSVVANETYESYSGLIILSVLIPLVGLIIYCVNHDSKPIKAKKCGKAALISFCVCFVIWIIGIVALSLL